MSGSIEEACALLAKLTMPVNARPEARQRRIGELMESTRDQAPAEVLRDLRRAVQVEGAKRNARREQDAALSIRDKRLAEMKAKRRKRK